MIHKDLLCHKYQVDGQYVRQFCGSSVTNVTQVRTTAMLMLGTDRSNSKSKCNLKYSIAQGVYTGVLLCILCVVSLLIVDVVPCFMIDVRDVMLGNVLTPMPVV